MNATIKTNTNGNLTTIIIRRHSAFKTMCVPTTDAQSVIKALVIQLTNMGYRVQ